MKQKGEGTYLPPAITEFSLGFADLQLCFQDTERSYYKSAAEYVE